MSVGLIFGLHTSSAQVRDFDGIWSGTMTADDGDKFSLTLYIEDNTVYSVTTNDAGERVKVLSQDVSWSDGEGEQLTFIWMNTGGVWTETQMHSLVWINENELSVYHYRHVSNKSDSFDGNTDWGYASEGLLVKEGHHH